MSKGQVELEQAVLACMASSPRIAPKVAAVLDVQDFTTGPHRFIYRVMCDMLDEGTRIDNLTLLAELREDGYAEGTGTFEAAEGLYAVAASLASVEHAEEYAQVVREEGIRRRLTLGVDEALGRQGAGVEDVVAGLEGVVFDARSQLHSREGMKSLSGASILRYLSVNESASESVGGYPYPFPSMRAEYGDYERGRYTILGGPSGDGKTTLAFQWAWEMVEAGARVCIDELEMTALQVSRLLAVQSGAITYRQAKGIDVMDLDAEARLREFGKTLTKLGDQLVINCGPSTPATIRAHQARERFDVRVIDHMQKFPRTAAGEYVDMTNYSGQIHRITRDLDCSAIALVQLKKASRDREGRTRRQVPTVGDLRGTGAFEEDADEVLFVYQERDMADRRLGHGALLIGKMRDGEPDARIRFKLHVPTMRFREHDPNHTSGPSVLAKRQEDAS
jgi:replicative DNA helicase